LDCYDDSTSGAPYATTDRHGYDRKGIPKPKGSRTLATCLPSAQTVNDVAWTILGCPTPPISSIVRILQGIGVGITHTPFPHGHKYKIKLVHVDGCGINISKLSMIGILWTNTNAFATVSGLIGINGKGGHQHVKFFSTIDLGIGGLPQG
jgi:hypothetical protein